MTEKSDRPIEKVGVYYVEKVGYVTGLEEAERITQSFTGKPPKFIEWTYMGDEDEPAWMENGNEEE